MQGGALLAGASVSPGWLYALAPASAPLSEFGYGDVTLAGGLPESQLDETHAILMGLDDDALLKPFRLMAGVPAPGRDIGGWYRYDPDYVARQGRRGFCPRTLFRSMGFGAGSQLCDHRIERDAGPCSSAESSIGRGDLWGLF